MLDCVIRGGEVVDGTGRPGAAPTSASATAASSPSARSEEAAARRSTPAGASSRPASSTSTRTTTRRCSGTRRSRPSPLHGVTTVIGGNCGFTIAPLGPGARRLPDADARPRRGHAARVARRRACRGTGRRSASTSTASTARSPSNAGFLVGHSAIRRVVMGERRDTATRDARGARGDGAIARPKVSPPAASASRRRGRTTHNDADGDTGAVALRDRGRADRAVQVVSRAPGHDARVHPGDRAVRRARTSSS